MTKPQKKLESTIFRELRLLKGDLITMQSKAYRGLSKLLQMRWLPPIGLVSAIWYWADRKDGFPLPQAGNLSQYGAYGDSFGALTSLFTALGFGGLLITLAFQQRQITSQDSAEQRRHRKEAHAQYEDVLFRLLDMYRQTLSEVWVGDYEGRDVLRVAIDRVDKCLIEEAVHRFPKDIEDRYNSKTLTKGDLARMDYFYYRNFKIIPVEIAPQGRLIDTMEVLLQHLVDGAPDYLLIDLYKDLVFAQITHIEFKYYFLVALSVSNRVQLRDLLYRSGFIDRISRSAVHALHRRMYAEYWGVTIDGRNVPSSVPMNRSRINRAMSACRAAGEDPKRKYVPLFSRNSHQKEVVQDDDRDELGDDDLRPEDFSSDFTK